jgi:hypothetical protein
MLVREPLRVGIGAEERTFRELVRRDLEEALESARLRRIVDEDADRRGLVLADRRESVHATKWAIVDSNHGPPPYQSGALTN